MWLVAPIGCSVAWRNSGPLAGSSDTLANPPAPVTNAQRPSGRNTTCSGANGSEIGDPTWCGVPAIVSGNTVSESGLLVKPSRETVTRPDVAPLGTRAMMRVGVTDTTFAVSAAHVAQPPRRMACAPARVGSNPEPRIVIQPS